MQSISQILLRAAFSVHESFMVSEHIPTAGGDRIFRRKADCHQRPNARDLAGDRIGPRGIGEQLDLVLQTCRLDERRQ